MAIKGKKRSKQRPVARAPRREPVAVAPPVLQRRWVQVVAAFLVGVFAMVLFVWITNAMRASDDEAAAGDRTVTRLAAATAYQQAVREAFSRIGVVEPGVTPQVLTEMDAAIDGLAAGEAPADAAGTLEQAAADASDVREQLASFDLTGTISDQGFDAVEATAFTNSSQALQDALSLYRQAARVGAAAAAASGDEAAELADVAVELRNSARRQLDDGWTEYLQAVRAGGAQEGPTDGGLVPELPGGGA